MFMSSLQLLIVKLCKPVSASHCGDRLKLWIHLGRQRAVYRLAWMYWTDINQDKLYQPDNVGDEHRHTHTSLCKCFSVETQANQNYNVLIMRLQRWLGGWVDSVMSSWWTQCKSSILETQLICLKIVLIVWGVWPTFLQCTVREQPWLLCLQHEFNIFHCISQ